MFEQVRRPLAVLDLGCSGGGFVRSCIDDGCIAVGVEGSDYSMRMGRAEWAELGGKYLFTADITRPFEIRAVYAGNEGPLQCDVVTAWEVLEHIAEPDIDGVCKNIAAHLAPSGIVAMSISIVEQEHNGVKLHQTVKPKSWWVAKFAEHGLHHQPALESYFAGQYVRGWGPEAGTSIHVVLARSAQAAPVPPGRSLKTKLADRWFASRPYWYVRRALGIQ